MEWFAKILDRLKAPESLFSLDFNYIFSDV